jgi:serine/threonine protein kinase
MNTTEEVIEELREALFPELILVERLGGGGMGDVFLARDPVLKRNVAVKVLSSRLGMSADSRRRFAREAESAAAVAHPNVVSIHHVGTLPRSHLGYIVMAHVDGPTLKEFRPEGSVASESEVRRIMAEIAAALAAAHARGVVHRDIKPANVLYDRPGDRFVVVDFGIASVLDRGTPAGARLTLEGLIGTPEYMSPEQAAGDPVSEKSDVYSLGCVAYELLTGKPPITGPTVAAVIRGHLADEPIPVGVLRSDVSPELAGLVMRCLRKDPAVRPTAGEVTRALGLESGAALGWPPPGLEPLHRQGSQWLKAAGRFATSLFFFVLILGIHPAAVRPCCADSPDRSPGWLLLRRLSMITPIHFDDADALAIWYFLLDASFFVALAALVPFLIGTARLVNRLGTGRRNGYPLPVLTQVAWDRHRDTRDLVNLTGRYAGVTPERQRSQVRRRTLGSAALALACLILIAGCLGWMGGGLELTGDPSSGLLPFAELALVAAPAAALLLLSAILEVIDPGHRRPSRQRGPTVQPLRADVRDAWLAGAGIEAPAEKWSPVVVRGAGLITAGIASLAVVLAAYGLIAVFGASARFAGDRSRGQAWLERYLAPGAADSLPPRLEPRSALALAAPVPLDLRVARALFDRRLPLEDRRILFEAIAPAFCLNPREVLFGLSRERMLEREGAARSFGADTAGWADFDPTPLVEAGLTGLRRRARYCERYIGDPATISPAFKP